jgi:hypothetical protein
VAVVQLVVRSSRADLAEAWLGSTEDRQLECCCLQVVTRIADFSSASGTSSSAAAAGSSTTPSSAGLLAPALGEGWGQAASCRVALFWEGSQRCAMVTKAKHVPLKASGQPGRPKSMCVTYYVRPDGIC